MDFYKVRVEETKKYLKTLTCKNPYVAVSGGKDSLVMLHLVNEIFPNIPVFHWDHGNALIPRKIENDIISCIKKININIIYRKCHRASRTDYYIWYKAFFGTLSHLIKERNFDAAFIGLRKEESIKRRLRISNRNKFNFVQEYYPLADWKWQDVWAYIISNNISYPKIYDLYAKLKGYDKVRLVTFFDQEFEYLGSPYIDGFLMPEEKY